MTALTTGFRHLPLGSRSSPRRETARRLASWASSEVIARRVLMAAMTLTLPASAGLVLVALGRIVAFQ